MSKCVGLGVWLPWSQRQNKCEVCLSKEADSATYKENNISRCLSASLHQKASCMEAGSVSPQCLERHWHIQKLSGHWWGSEWRNGVTCSKITSPYRHSHTLTATLLWKRGPSPRPSYHSLAWVDPPDASRALFLPQTSPHSPPWLFLGAGPLTAWG